MKWTANQSIRLSKACIWLFAAAAAVLCAAAPALVHSYGATLFFDGRTLAQVRVPLLCTLYVTAVPGAYALWQLYRLLSGIGKGDAFTQGNSNILRRLSWCCIVAGLGLLFGAITCWLPLLLLAVFAAFIGLILRVVKNVFAEAVRIKDENDFTV